MSESYEAPGGVEQGKQGGGRPVHIGGECGELVYANEDGSDGECENCGTEPGEAWDLADGMRALSMLATEMERRGDPRQYGVNCAWWMLEKLSKTDDMTEALDELKARLYRMPTGPAPAPGHAEPGDRS